MHLRRVRDVGHTFAAALTHVSAVVTPPAKAAKKLCVGVRLLCRGQAGSGFLWVMMAHFSCAARHAKSVFSPQIWEDATHHAARRTNFQFSL
jgi:hypothetical protein